MGQKSIQKTGPNTGLETIHGVHSGCPSMRPDTYSIAPRPTQKAGSPTAHEKTEGTVLSLSGVPGRAVCPR